MSTCKIEPSEFLKKKIIVIGAGISGLGCAAHLKKLGFQNVLVLEARNRIGGRTHTVDIGNYYIEIGAQWIHGQEGNVIFDLANSTGLIDETAPYYMDAILKFGNLLPENETLLLQDLVIYLEDKTSSIPYDIDNNISLSDYLDKHFENYSLNHETANLPLMKSAYNWYRKMNCELNGCQNLSLVNARLLNQYEECDGVQTVELKQGYKSVLDVVLQNIPDDWIQLNKTVRKVDWSGFQSENCSNSTNYQKVAVSCEDESLYFADHVIITVPLGFLKKHMETLFIPNLSLKKQAAVQKLGFDAVNKIFLEFEDPFWSSSDVYPVFWDDALEKVFQNNSDRSAKDSKLWIKDLNRFAYTPSHPKMLTGWITGHGAIEMESLSDEEISSCCMKILETIIDLPLPQPSKIIRSKWHSDVFTHGSYSYLTMECDEQSNLDIAEPEFSSTPCTKHPVLQFAGEATNTAHFSTVHGAYETGIREAIRLFEHYRY